MEEDVVDGQAILHCLNCGGTFFQKNGINRISFETAKKLASEKQSSDVSTQDKLCPKDQTTLTPLPSKENIPPDVILFRCVTCEGVFASPDDLVIFKKAQEVKIDYFKLWGIPFASFKSIAVVSFLLFISVVSFTAILYLQKQNIYQIQAKDMIKNLFLTTSNQYLFVSFKTSLPVRSRIVFTNRTTSQTIEKIINSQPTTDHRLTTTDIKLGDEIYYQIILSDEKGRETKTEMKLLEL